MALRVIHIAVAAAASAALAACETTPLYAPAESSGDFGYTEQRIEDDRFLVRFRGGGRDVTAADLALLRAAELTHQYGYDWFEVVRRGEAVDTQRSSGSGMTVGIGRASGSRGSSVGVGVGLSFPLGQSADAPATEAFVEVILRDGEAPDDANAYSARDIIARIGPLAP